MIELDDGRLWKRHIDQLRPGPVNPDSTSCFPLTRSTLRPSVPPLAPQECTSNSPKVSTDASRSAESSNPVSSADQDISLGQRSVPSKTAQPHVQPISSPTISDSDLRRSSRMRKAPNRLDL